MYELKKNGKVFTSKSVGTGPSSYEKRIYRTAVSQRLRNCGLIYTRKYANCQRHINIILFVPPLAMFLFPVLLNNKFVNSLYKSFTKKKYPLSRTALSLSLTVYI